MNPDVKHFPLRLPEYLYKQLEKKAKKSMYSVNLLIIEAIRKSLE